MSLCAWREFRLPALRERRIAQRTHRLSSIVPASCESPVYLSGHRNRESCELVVFMLVAAKENVAEEPLRMRVLRAIAAWPRAAWARP
jgi:hypothetical protein